MSVVDEIKERLDVVDVISDYVPLKKAGRNYKALCPFHTEKTPSFVVFPDTQSWYCFGACGSGGDVFTFVMKMENMEFSEALRFLAQKAGVSLAPRGKEEMAEERKQRLLQEINAAAAQYFHNLLLHSPEGATARDHLAQRQINTQTIEAFQLGYALDDWEATKIYLNGQGYSLRDIHDAGLIIERESGGYYDRFRGRLMFPIRDLQGNTVGFGARALDDSLPKYLNSPQTPIFDKSSALYGVDLAKRAIRDEGLAIIVEGYMDVLTAHQNGFRNVVASMGTALTETQLGTLKRLTKSFALALDADVAGDQATLRGLEVAKQVLDRRTVPIPTWQGLIRYEGRLDAEIKIITLPLGKDPDDVIREGPQHWVELVEGALPVVDYYFAVVTAGLDLDSAKDKSSAVRQLAPIIQEIGDGVERAHYLQKLARLIRVDERVILREMGRRAKAGRGAREQRSGGDFSPAPQHPCSSAGLEEYCLALLLREPGLLGRVKGLEAEDFTRIENRELFVALGDHACQEERFGLEGFLAGLDPALCDHADSLLQRSAEKPPLTDAELENEAQICALKIKHRNYRWELEQVGLLLMDLQGPGGSEERAALGRRVALLEEELRRVQRALSARTILGPKERASAF